MSEKRVSGKSSRTEEEKLYNEFVRQYRFDKKKKNETAAEPKKVSGVSKYRLKNSGEAEPDNGRCREIDPHTTINPVLQRQIITKKVNRILSDDTGFKSDSYNTRFRLYPDMPENDGQSKNDSSENLYENLPGQQTMLDIMDGDKAVPVEEAAEINSKEDVFSSAYRSVKNEDIKYYGKSEKLRAIARTAAEDINMEMDNQLVFPSFDPLFKFPEEEKTSGKERKHKKHKTDKKAVKGFDIEESEIVTGKAVEEEKTDAEKEIPEESNSEIKKNNFFEQLNKNKTSEAEPTVELNSRDDYKNVAAYIKKLKVINLVKCAVTALSGIILFVISLVADSKSANALSANPKLYMTLTFVMLTFAAVAGIKDIIDGVKNIFKGHFSVSSGVFLIFLVSYVQTASMFFMKDSFSGIVHSVVPAAVLSLLPLCLSRLFMTDNMRLNVNLNMGGNTLYALKSAGSVGAEGAVKSDFSSDGKSVRFTAKTDFLMGLIKKLTNAVPHAAGENAAVVIAVVLSLVTGIGSAIVNQSFISGVTASLAALSVSVPTLYMFFASTILLREEKKLADKKSSVISYKSAEDAVNTSAMVFSTSDIVEQSSCNIHGVKSFNGADPKKAMLLASSVITSSSSPLSEIVRQIVSQSGDVIPEAKNINIVNEKGIGATVSRVPVLLGTRDFMEENRIRVPDDSGMADELTGDRKLLYFAAQGKLALVLVVSYHIKRNVSSFFRYLAGRNIKIIIHTADANLSAGYIMKKCKLPENSVVTADEVSSSYFREKSFVTEPALPSDVFYSGKLTSLSLLMKTAGKLAAVIKRLPFIDLAAALVCALLVIVPSLSGSIYSVSSAYIIILKILCVIIGFIAALAGTDKS